MISRRDRILGTFYWWRRYLWNVCWVIPWNKFRSERARVKDTK